jgi:predicted alpha/beta-hydrolase family hydrolase
MLNTHSIKLLSKLIAFILAFSSLNLYAQTDTIKTITTPRGENIQHISSFPKGNGPFPNLVLAPGAGYHMQLPLMEEIDRQLVNNGIAVIRFNWAYFNSKTRKASPSLNLDLEYEDFLTVLNHAKADTRTDKGNLFIGGKSLGTGVAWRLFKNLSDLKALVLLTPICSKTVDGSTTSEIEQNYPQLNKETRPVLFIMGDQDPVCASHILFPYLADLKNNMTASIIGGNHGFENPQLNTEDALDFKKRSIALVSKLVEDFIQRTSINIRKN